MTTAFEVERGLRKVPDRYEHGTRMRYACGCKCFHCRRANSSYEAQRIAARKAGDWNGLIDAAPARAHILALSAEGVGRDLVADAAKVSLTTIVEIRSGAKTKVRARTARAILGVTSAAAGDAKLVDAAPTWRLLDELLADGYKKTHLALELGSTAAQPALQIKRDRVTLKTERAVELMHKRMHLVDALPTMNLLRELAEEGYHAARITKDLAEFAAARGLAGPDLKIRRVRILATTAELVERFHAEVTAA